MNILLPKLKNVWILLINRLNCAVADCCCVASETHRVAMPE